MPYTGTVNGPPVNVVGVHQNDEVPHDLVDGKHKLMEVAIQLVNVSVIIVGNVCELLQAIKLYDHHHHKPVSEKYNNKNDSRGHPPDRSLLCIVEKSHRLATSPPCMWWVGDKRITILTSHQGDAPEWWSFSSLRLCWPCPVRTIGWCGTNNVKIFKALSFIS